MWDFALDPNTQDWIFGANHDLLSVSGEDLDRQRIGVRLRIPQGTFRYDETGKLGSRLHTAARMNTDRGAAEIPILIKEALAPMEDIVVRDIDVQADETDPGKMNVIVKYDYAADREEVRVQDETNELEITITL